MPEDDSRLLLHLARAVEELLRAAAEAAGHARERLESSREPHSAVSELLAKLIENAEGAGLEQLRGALRRELLRWSDRARNDRAAAQLRDLFAALLDVLEPDKSVSGNRPEAGRSAPRTRRTARKRAP